MAYDEALNERYRSALAGLNGISEKKMMGGLCFLIDGNMVGGADRTKDGNARFMFRVGKENEASVLELPGAYPMTMGQRRMTGLVFVDGDTLNDTDFRKCTALAVEFAGGLPPKSKA